MSEKTEEEAGKKITIKQYFLMIKSLQKMYCKKRPKIQQKKQ